VSATTVAVRCSNNAECTSSKHFIDCPQLPDAERAERYKGQYETAFKRVSTYNRILKRYLTDIELWRGKFREVKHENNKLRQRLYQREHPPQTESEG